MQSITQLIDLLKQFQSLAFVFTTNLEPLIMADSVPDYLSHQINHVDFIRLINRCQKDLKDLNDYINVLHPSIKKGLKAILKKNPSKKDPVIPYADFKVDEMPVFHKCERHEQLSFEQLLAQAEQNGKPIQPIHKRTNCSFEGVCPHCGAPHTFIYLNNGKGQFKCKICNRTFTLKTTSSDQVGIYCPHCGRKLHEKHNRKGYIVYVCMNQKCSYYKKNKKLFKKGHTEVLKTSSKQYRFRYHYRDFKFSIETLKKASQHDDINFDLTRIHFDQKVLGLVLTYFVNYGLSSRKTALILRQVHGLSISHQTVMNYASMVSKLVKPMVDKYNYSLTSTLTGDETYIKVRGKNHYVFFWSDPNTKVITSYTIYATRDTQNACQSIHDCLSKYKEIPKDMTLITDGNPIYNAAQLFYKINDIDFTLKQVIGVKNKDEESKEYRPYKQIEERLNRTYKQNYYGTNGYHTLESANTYMVLYVCFFNFLRQHSSIGFKTPVHDNLFEDEDLMQDKWLKLIEMSAGYFV